MDSFQATTLEASFGMNGDKRRRDYMARSYGSRNKMNEWWNMNGSGHACNQSVVIPQGNIGQLTPAQVWKINDNLVNTGFSGNEVLKDLREFMKSIHVCSNLNCDPEAITGYVCAEKYSRFLRLLNVIGKPEYNTVELSDMNAQLIRCKEAYAIGDVWMSAKISIMRKEFDSLSRLVSVIVDANDKMVEAIMLLGMSSVEVVGNTQMSVFSRDEYNLSKQKILDAGYKDEEIQQALKLVGHKFGVDNGVSNFVEGDNLAYTTNGQSYDIEEVIEEIEADKINNDFDEQLVTKTVDELVQSGTLPPYEQEDEVDGGMTFLNILFTEVDEPEAPPLSKSVTSGRYYRSTHINVDDFDEKTTFIITCGNRTRKLNSEQMRSFTSWISKAYGKVTSTVKAINDSGIIGSTVNKYNKLNVATKNVTGKGIDEWILYVLGYTPSAYSTRDAFDADKANMIRAMTNIVPLCFNSGGLFKQIDTHVSDRYKINQSSALALRRRMRI